MHNTSMHTHTHAPYSRSTLYMVYGCVHIQHTVNIQAVSRKRTRRPVRRGASACACAMRMRMLGCQCTHTTYSMPKI